MMKKVLVWIVAVSMILMLFGCVKIERDETTDTSVASDEAVLEEQKAEDYKVFDGIISNEELIENICEALREIGISPQKILSLKRVDDWIAGERYNFSYKGKGLTIYTNMDFTINSISMGVDADIYKQGFEAYNIENFIIDSDMEDKLILKAEDKVKPYLNYPATADFSLFDWGFSRDHELYSVSSSVKAKNAFGVESEVPFMLTYKVEENTMTLVYFVIGGQVIVNDEKSLKRPDRKEVAFQKEGNQDNSEKTSEITLIDGQLGEYGKEVSVGGYKHINYYVPQGTYMVKNKVKWCVVFVAKDDYFKNSDGYMENEIVQRIELDSPDKTATITVNQGEHIELTMNASVLLIAE